MNIPRALKRVSRQRIGDEIREAKQCLARAILRHFTPVNAPFVLDDLATVANEGRWPVTSKPTSSIKGGVRRSSRMSFCLIPAGVPRADAARVGDKCVAHVQPERREKKTRRRRPDFVMTFEE
jgi:hypothetical protein